MLGPLWLSRMLESVKSTTATSENAGLPRAAAPDLPPPSVTSVGTTALGLICFLTALPFISYSGINIVEQSALAMIAAMLPMIAIDLAIHKVHRNPSTGLVWDTPRPIDWERVAIKFIGLMATLVALGLVYTMFREYHRIYYLAFWALVTKYGGIFVLASVPYIALVDARMREPRDAYWQLGCLCLGRRKDVKFDEIAEHFRGWAVKGFFLPLMFVFLTLNMSAAQHWFASLSTDFTLLKLFNFLVYLLFTTDVVFGVVGYLMTLRVIDAHLRWAEPTVLGWLVAVMCYPPFWTALHEKYFTYGGAVNWQGYFAGLPALQVLWGTAILFLLSIYVWATVIFGCRFSNLTHRGVITNGPYRFTKHPAYISKNLSWWLIAIPFIPQASAAETIRNCLILLMVNFVYFMRAKTEERHLSRDPTYVAYAAWIDRHGIFRGLVGRMPLLRYRPRPLAAPASAAPS